MDPAGDFELHNKTLWCISTKVQKCNEKAFVDADVVLHKLEPNSLQTSAHDVTAAAPKSSVETLESGLQRR